MSLGTELKRVAPALRRRADRLGGVAAAWLDVVPPSLADLATIEGVRGGTLSLSVDSASAKFRLDRALREGLDAAMRRRLPSIRSIRVRIAGTDADDSTRRPRR
jgi:hypothetical protein